MRIFAGPNGSGKTTTINQLRSKIKFGVYVNADDIEALLKTNLTLSLEEYQIKLNTSQVRNFLLKKGFAITKFSDTDFISKIKIENNCLKVTSKNIINSYLVADIVELIRRKLILKKVSFSYETVMSHKAKINFIEKAKVLGYKIYLYYIVTEDPEININRVNIRVAQHGHAVSPEKITQRYYKSLENLKPTIKLTNRTYLFDNSGAINLLIAEVTNGIDVTMMDTKKVPNWFVKYVIGK
ncbi:MAG: hypothetical protein RL065_1613 [Bacteroidota bacterium]